MLKKILLATLLIALTASVFAFAANDTASVKLVANVPVRAIVADDTFSFNNNGSLTVSVTGAEQVSNNVWTAVADEVVVEYTAI